MRITSGLKPEKVFEYFEDICAIPHGSGNTFAISQYCVDFALKHGLEVSRDSLNNVIIKKPASNGYEDHNAVMIQGHLDMVCEKEKDCKIDFEKDGLDLNIKDGYLIANGTTLGGDDGIAIAMALAILEDDCIQHPPLIAVFTVDEETGMFGAEGIDLSGIDSKILINIDSEAESVLTVSCAGGIRSTVTVPINKTDSFGNVYKINLSGLTGGHSGVEIHCGRLNANKVMARLLLFISDSFEIGISSIKGGLKDNAITRECEAVICCETDLNTLQSICDSFLNKLDTENDSETKISVSDFDAKFVSDIYSSKNIINFLCEVPNGVVKMSDNIDGLVETSLNIGVLNVDEDELCANFSIRSSVNSQKIELADKVKHIAEKHGGSAVCDSEYPAWEYKKESVLRDVMINVHSRLYGKEPVVEAIHAGLECGILCDKIPGLDAVSFGPNILDIHTPSERLEIASVERTYNYLLEILKEL